VYIHVQQSLANSGLTIAEFSIQFLISDFMNLLFLTCVHNEKKLMVSEGTDPYLLEAWMQQHVKVVFSFPISTAVNFFFCNTS
jgi:hypothetical protein